MAAQLPPPKREEEEQQDRAPRRGLLPGDFAAEQDLPWIMEEVIQRSVEEERQLGARRVMEAELDELRLQYALAASRNGVADSDSSDFDFGSSDSD